jgi:hypothetical protein
MTQQKHTIEELVALMHEHDGTTPEDARRDHERVMHRNEQKSESKK